MQPRQRQVGDVLQERREDLGLDLDEIGAMLRIKPAYLAALEQGRSDDLPGAAYAIGFIRAYSDFLGLNTDQVLARFKGEVAGVTARPDLALPVPLGERSVPGRALVLVALIVTLCGYGIWYYLSTGDRNRPERVAAVPAELRNLTTPMLVAPQTPQPAATAPNPPANPVQNAPAPNPAAAVPSPAPGTPAKPAPQVVAAAAQPAPPPVQPKPAQPPAAAPPTLQQVIAAAQSSPAPVQPKPVPPAQPAPTPPASSAPPASAPQQTAAAQPAPGPAPTAASKISIRAVADCWIQIRASDQSIVFSKILKSGEVYNVPVRQGLSLRTGNAGVLQIAVDGKPAPSIGGVGALLRDVALDPAALAAGTAVHG